MEQHTAGTLNLRVKFNPELAGQVATVLQQALDAAATVVSEGNLEIISGGINVTGTFTAGDEGWEF